MNPAVAAVLEDALDAGARVVAGDPNGDVIPIGRGQYAPTVRVLTAAIDYLWGWRDLLRGDKRYALPRFGPCVVSEWYFS